LLLLLLLLLFASVLEAITLCCFPVLVGRAVALGRRLDAADAASEEWQRRHREVQALSDQAYDIMRAEISGKEEQLADMHEELARRSRGANGDDDGDDDFDRKRAAQVTLTPPPPLPLSSPHNLSP
jgi:hypothetical protein